MNKCFVFFCKKNVFLLSHHNQALTAGQKNCLTEIVTVSYYKTEEKTRYLSIQILKLNYQHFSSDHDT